MRTIKILLLSHMFFLCCFSFEMTKEEAINQFAPKMPPKFFYYKMKQREIQYVRTKFNKKAKAILIFIHGSPGSWSAYIDYLKNPDLQKVSIMYSVDRLGFGGSRIGGVEKSLEKQASVFLPILKLVPQNIPIILIGHSYGAPVAVRMAMDYPKYIKGLVLIAGSIAEEYEEIYWYNKLGSLWLVRKLLPRIWEVSNTEILALKSELKKITPLWKKLKIPIIAIHGEKDNLVPVENLDFLRKTVPKKNLHILQPPKEGHFILWKNKKLIIDEILKLVHKIKK